MDDAVENEQIEALLGLPLQTGRRRGGARLERLREAISAGENLMEASIGCAEAGVTTGEWADTLRSVFGEYRAPTGVGGVAGGEASAEMRAVTRRVRQLSDLLGRNLKLLVGKPGLDGHSNGAEQVAVKARDVGMEVVYEGIRLTPEQIAESALQEGVHVVGLSILSGSHLKLVPEVLRGLKSAASRSCRCCWAASSRRTTSGRCRRSPSGACSRRGITISTGSCPKSSTSLPPPTLSSSP
ncbi:MAG: cobalamin-dependent protein [Desulfobacterales bacterium]|nr:cobalamin-dependent protein [Desulfobacterales bacterium]